MTSNNSARKETGLCDLCYRGEDGIKTGSSLSYSRTLRSGLEAWKGRELRKGRVGSQIELSSSCKGMGNLSHWVERQPTHCWGLGSRQVGYVLEAGGGSEGLGGQPCFRLALAELLSWLLLKVRLDCTETWSIIASMLWHPTCLSHSSQPEISLRVPERWIKWKDFSIVLF